MVIKKSKLAYVLLTIFIMIICLFPKLSIISISGSSAGIRIDDILIAILTLLLLPTINKIGSNDINVKKLLKLFIMYLVVCIISIIVGTMNNYINPSMGLFYFIRKIEYFIAIFFGYVYYKYGINDTKFKWFINFVVIFHLIFCLLQYFRFVGSFHGGKVLETLTQSRVSSIFNGAYEMSAFLLLLLPIYLYDIIKLKKNIFINLFFVIIILFCILISQSRISLIAFLGVSSLMVYQLTKKTKKSKIIILSALIFICISGFLFIKFGNSKISNRLKVISISNYVEVTSCAWNNKSFDIYLKAGIWYTKEKCLYIGTDYSWNLRVNHWMQLIDGTLRSPFFGNGLSITSNAADGEYVRILSESGIIGLIAFMFIIWTIISALNKNKQNRYCQTVKYSLYTMLVGSLFIDIFSASKVAMSFWFMLGIALASIGDKNEKLDNSK